MDYEKFYIGKLDMMKILSVVQGWLHKKIVILFLGIEFRGLSLCINLVNHSVVR